MQFSYAIRALEHKSVQDFFNGSIDIEEFAREENGWLGDYKILVAWGLVISNPKAFGFQVVDNQLVGPVGEVLRSFFPQARHPSQDSFALHLHAATRPGDSQRCLTLPHELIELVREHIGNPDGGIAKYFREHKLEVPTKLDPEVAEAALAKNLTDDEARTKENIKLQQRVERRERLKTSVLTAFLDGSQDLEEMQIYDSDRSGPQISGRKFARTHKALIAWALIVANPDTFGFIIEDDKLLGRSKALTDVFRYDSDVLAASHSAGLHLREKGSLRLMATLPKVMIELVREHIGNPDGGIAKYFREHKLEVPTKLDPEVAEAALAPEYKTEQAVSETSSETPGGTIETEVQNRSSVDPVVLDAAEKLYAQLRKIHTPEVLAALKYLL